MPDDDLENDLDDTLDAAVLLALSGLVDDSLPPDALRRDVPLFDELGLSSLQLVMLLTQLCEAHGIDLMSLSDTDLRRMRTPGDIAAALRRARLAQAGIDP